MGLLGELEKNLLSKGTWGLGVKDMSSFNFALLAKWRWYLFNNRGELWYRMLEFNYLGWRRLSD